MKYLIVEVSTHARSSKLYLLVDFWLDSQDPATEPPYQTQDFILDIRAAYQGIVTNSQGDLQLTNGSFISRADYRALSDAQKAALQFQRETVANDVAAEARGLIEKYWVQEMARGPRPGNLTDPQASRNQTDLRGVLTPAKSLEGTEVSR